ncbi:MAG TPA: methylated-DNA--[protein]-cysteine S-methyltransferase [Chloroflexi bacterium]|nr:methylated-DNA--[protein]-cysteine S-methyltransferase [Chloroflexota bacterium]
MELGVEAGIAYAWIGSPVGPVWVAATPRGVCAVKLGVEQRASFLNWLAQNVSEVPPREDPAALVSALIQFREYFCGNRYAFDLPLDVRGTPFQRDVWEEIARIPYGTTATYGDIARRINRPQAARAVGGANGANPVSIIIPCHRVIGADGSLTGYGAGIWIKAKLLRLEDVLLV